MDNKYNDNDNTDDGNNNANSKEIAQILLLWKRTEIWNDNP